MTSEAVSLAASGRLLGWLLVREIDEELVSSLAEPSLRDSLMEFGLDVSSLTAEQREILKSDYFAALVSPKEYPPPVQSLWQEGRYEGDAAASVRKVAEAMGVELDHEVARGAPPDHLGVELLLWAELAERSSSAQEFANQHLLWAKPALDALAAREFRGGDGFYGRLAIAVNRFISVITSEDASG